MKFATVTWVLLSLLLPAYSARGQSLNDAEQKVWNEFKAAGEMNDLRAQEKLAQRKKPEMSRIFDEFEASLAYSDSLDLWNDYKAVGRVLDNTDGSNYHTVEMRLIEKMSLENRQKRLDLRNQYDAARGALRAASEAKDKKAIQEGMDRLLEVAKSFAEIGDPVFQSYALSEVATVLNASDQQIDAVRMYDDIDRALTAAGFEKFLFLGEVRSTRDRLKAAGYDPSAKPGDKPAGPAGNTGTSWSKDPAGERYSDPVALKLVVDEKVTSNFVTPSSANTDNSFRWSSYRVTGTKPVPFEAQFQPFGQPFNVRRDGVKIYMDEGDGKEREIKCIQKPNLVEMDREIKDIDGNPSKLSYAWLSATGGQESIFGFNANFTNGEDGFTVRYHSACYLRGKVLDQDLLIFDDNSSGKFGDPFPVRDGTTLSGPTFVYNDAMMVGKEKSAGPWTEYMNVNGEFYRLKLDPENYAVRTRKLSVDTGTVRYKFDGKTKPSVLVIEETAEFKGAFFAISEAQPTVVPVGTYKLSHGIIRVGKGKSEKTCEIFPGESRTFEVKKGEESVLELGAPFKFDFQTERTPDGSIKVIGKSVVVTGKSDELYIRFYDDPPIPDKVVARVKGGKGGGKAEKMRKATFEDFRQDGAAAWSPLDLLLPGKSGTDYEVQLSLKKYPLLGAEIESDWK